MSHGSSENFKILPYAICQAAIKYMGGVANMSVATSRKGIGTKQVIIDTTKNLFKQKGFAKTSIKDICELANVKPGTFTYYFNSKDDLIGELYGRMFNECYEFVESKLDRLMNSLEKNTIVAFLYFYAIFADEKSMAFHHEILIKGSVGDYITQSAFPISEQFIKDFNLNFTQKELRDIDLAENGLSRELVIHFLENPNERSIVDLVNTIYIFRARLFTIDENLMKVYLFNGMEFERTFDHSHITLLG